MNTPAREYDRVVKTTYKRTYLTSVDDPGLKERWEVASKRTSLEEQQWLLLSTVGDIVDEKFVMDRILGIRAQTPTVFPPVVTLMTLYSTTNDLTLVDREVRSLCQAGKLKELSTPQGDEALILMMDYERIVANVSGIASALLKKFVEQACGQMGQSVSVEKCVLKSGLNCTETDLASLTSRSLLSLHANSLKLYWNVPGLQSVFAHVRNGLQHLVPHLRSKRPPLLPLQQIMLKRPKNCLFPWPLVLAHAVGDGVLQSINSPAGIIVKLTRKGTLQQSSPNLRKWSRV